MPSPGPCSRRASATTLTMSLPYRSVRSLSSVRKRRAGEIGFHAQHAVEFDGMADRFVDLQAELRAIEDDVELALGTLVRGVQRDCFFGDRRAFSTSFSSSTSS